MTAARSGPDDCSTCHGADLKGGISGVSCTSCHLGSPTSVHPADWVPVYSMHDPYVETNGTGACANLYCHGASLTGVANSGPSCTSCHMGGVTEIHPAGWLGDACSNHGSYAFINGTAGCANAACHGADLGGVSQSGPSCTQCHNPIPNSCNSCHGIPPNGAFYPNTAGKHAKHMQLSNVTCATCHARSCDQHGNGIVEVIFDPIYNAKTGIASFNTTSSAKTCSEISCHGGSRMQTPDQAAMNPPQSDPGQTSDWYTGAINVYDNPTYLNAQCKACHIYGTTEYNGFYSGEHFVHVFSPDLSTPTPTDYLYNYACDSCHDYNKLAVTHFTGLSTTVISAGTASATILDIRHYDGTTCTSCHGPGENWWPIIP